jgi:2'-5' RNA ligase
MRTFIAIYISPEIRSAVGDLQEQIRSEANLPKGEVTWVKPDNMHLTIKFLGEVPEEKIPEIQAAAAEVCRGHNHFEVEVKNVGTFGRPAKVLWVGVHTRNKELINLQKDLEESLAKFGFPPEDREFSGHLTLARIKGFKAAKRLSLAAGDFKNIDLGTFTAESVQIYKSQLTPDGSVYTLVGKCELKN